MAVQPAYLYVLFIYTIVCKKKLIIRIICADVKGFTYHEELSSGYDFRFKRHSLDMLGFHIVRIRHQQQTECTGCSNQFEDMKVDKPL